MEKSDDRILDLYDHNEFADTHYHGVMRMCISVQAACKDQFRLRISHKDVYEE